MFAVALLTATVNGTAVFPGTTLAGLTEQTGGAPGPQLSATVFAYPLRAVIVPLNDAVAFTCEDKLALLTAITKSGVAATVSESGWIFVIAPGLDALIDNCELPRAAPEDALTTSATDTGLPDVGVADGGWNWQLTPAGGLPQERFTGPTKEPAAPNVNTTGPLLAPGTSVIAAGEGMPSVKSTTCKTRGNVCVTAAGSVPVAWRPNE